MYDRTFYDVIRPGCQSSADAVVAVLASTGVIRAGNRVLDVGGGEGWWSAACETIGCTATCLDDGDVPPEARAVADWRKRDLRTGVIVEGDFDVALCLEMAEHLTERAAGSLVRSLCDAAPVVVFSAAIPGQGGTGHVNEQPPAYWAQLFSNENRDVSGAWRWLIWNDDRVENWYRQNLLVAVKPGHVLTRSVMFTGPWAHPLHVVHPVLFDARRQ